MVIQPVLGLGEKGEKKSHILASGSAAPWGWPQHQASVRTSISVMGPARMIVFAMLLRIQAINAGIAEIAVLLNKYIFTHGHTTVRENAFETPSSTPINNFSDHFP